MSPYLAALLLLIPGPANPAPATPTDPEPLRSRLAAVSPAGSALRIDPATGTVVVKLGGEPSSAFASLAAAHPAKVRWERGPAVQPLILVRGGMAITNTATPPCTAGLAMKSVSGSRYVVTAGHCVAAGNLFWYLDGYTIGPAAYHSWPDNDYAAILVAYNSPVTTHPTLIQRGSSASRVLGTNNPRVGHILCKSGAVSGVTCGTVLALNVTVTYHGGEVVNGLIETNICAFKGDSGSPLYLDHGDSRLIGMGILSGGNLVVCGDPAVRSYHNPLTEIMAAYGLSLIT